MNGKVKVILVGIVMFAIGFGVSYLVSNRKPAIKTETDKVSYSIGVHFANSIEEENIAMLEEKGIDVNPEAVVQGLSDVLSGGELKMSDDQVSDNIEYLKKRLNNNQEENTKKAEESTQSMEENNVNNDQAFLEKNKSAEGVKTLPSGLQYKIIKQGNGEKPKLSDTVRCHYKGTLVDGTEFDSSYKRGEPASFPVSGVIAGWTEALQLMPVGSKWQLFIPSKLGYGERGTPGGPIGPNATLIFEIELLGIE